VFKKIIKILPKIFRILFYLSLITGIGIDVYYKFDIPEAGPFGIISLVGYLYSCLYFGVQLGRRFLKIKSLIIRSLVYICLWAIIIKILNVSSQTSEGWRGTAEPVIVFTTFFAAILMTFNFPKNFFKRKLPVILVVAMIFFVSSMVNWDEINLQPSEKTAEEKTDTQTSLVLIQPWQLNSRYKINKIVKFLKADLDKDDKEELAAITSYDQMPDEVFYYAGFYRYNPATEKWDEFYSEELNILNYGIIKEEIKEEESEEFKKKLIEMWSTEFTTLENLGDLTGDGCPEIVFSSLLQGKDFDNYLIVAQAGESHYYYKIFSDQNTMAKIIAEDNSLIEKYYDQTYDYKDIYRWDGDYLLFKLIESQKTKTIPPEPPKAIPGLEKFST